MGNENLAINIIDDIVSKTDLLEAFFSRGDKEPSWDGFIYAYRNKKKLKSQMYGRAAVQIKSTEKNPKKKYRVTFSVNYADIENYRNDGGAIFFLVYIDGEKNRIVYHAPLLPFTLNELLEKHNGKKHFSLHLQEFPYAPKDVENLVINFIENCHRQSSPIRKNWTFEELVKIFNLKTPRIKYHFTDVYKYEDPMDYLFNHFTEMYVPVDLTKQEYPIGSSKLEFITKKMNLSVKANGKKFYDFYNVVRDKNGYSLSVGNGVLSTITRDSSTEFSFKVDGTLAEQIKKGDFLLSVFDSGSIEFGKNSIKIDIESISDEGRKKIEELRKKHMWNKDLQATLDKVGVREELRFNNWQEKDIFYANQLIKSILYNEPVRLPDSLEAMSIIRIGDIGVGVINQRLETGLFSMRNMFENKDVIVLLLEPNHVPTSQYVALNCNNILQISNIDYGVMYNSIKRFHSLEHYSAVNNLVLQMLLAYDKKHNTELLNATIKISKWLHTEAPEDPYYLLNWYQSVYRKRKTDKRIDYEKVQRLIDNGDIDVKVGAAILAGQHELAKRLIEKMPKKKQKEFSDFPILHLLYQRNRDN